MRGNNFYDIEQVNEAIKEYCVEKGCEKALFKFRSADQSGNFFKECSKNKYMNCPYNQPSSHCRSQFKDNSPHIPCKKENYWVLSDVIDGRHPDKQAFKDVKFAMYPHPDSEDGYIDMTTVLTKLTSKSAIHDALKELFSVQGIEITDKNIMKVVLTKLKIQSAS